MLGGITVAILHHLCKIDRFRCNIQLNLSKSKIGPAVIQRLKFYIQMLINKLRLSVYSTRYTLSVITITVINYLYLYNSITKC